MSLGLTTNYKEIEDLCNEFISKGVTIVCSYPKKGNSFCISASYDGVVKVTSEWMCKDEKSGNFK